MSDSHSAPDLVVIGGGIIGLSCAEALALRGLRVRLLDRDGASTESEEVSRAASWASAGMIAPLAEVPDDDAFLRVCLHSRDLWSSWAPSLEDATGLDLDYDRSGAFLVADQPLGGPDRLARFESAAHRAGEPSERPTVDEVRRVIPDAAADLDFGLRLPGEHRVDNRKVCQALRRRLRDLGVEMTRGEVRSIDRDRGGLVIKTDTVREKAGSVLVCAGAWSSRIGGLPTLPISPLRGQMLRLARVDWPFQGCVRGTGFYAARRRNGDLLIGATEDDAGFDCRVTAEGLAQLTHWLRRVFPTLSHHPVTETWAGLRPSTPDGRPILSRLDDDLWVAAGHHRNGILLTPWTSEVMASWIAEGEAPQERDLVSLDRFASAATHA